MACHVLFLKNETEFYSLLRERDPDLILKMIKCVLNAIRHKRDRVDIFDITFKDTTEMVFSIDQDQYKTILKNCLGDLEKMEEYELCAEIKKISEKKTRQRKQKEKI